MNPIILYRNDTDWRAEEHAARKYFTCISRRMEVPENVLVIPRFSALPFFKELEDDVKYAKSSLINNLSQHQYIADLQNWYYDLKDFTPETWSDLSRIPEEGPFVLKGETNSKKFLWNTHMFARNKREAIEVHSRLLQDSLLQYQKIYIRRFVPLEEVDVGFNGLPISKEYRFFVYKRKILSGAFYWSSHDVKADHNEVPREFLNDVIDKIQCTELADPPNFYVIDVAKTKSGDWIVIELNDGTMSGLSNNDPDVLYRELKEALDDQSLDAG
jgi:hypothetical protein